MTRPADEFGYEAAYLDGAAAGRERPTMPLSGAVKRYPVALSGPRPRRGAEYPARGQTERMNASAWIDNREVKCRCGQIGVITGVEGDDAHPDNVWVSHRVRLAMQTHIHRKLQIPALLTQLTRPTR